MIRVDFSAILFHLRGLFLPQTLPQLLCLGELCPHPVISGHSSLLLPEGPVWVTTLQCDAEFFTWYGQNPVTKF